jgi:hypothetical protein
MRKIKGKEFSVDRDRFYIDGYSIAGFRTSKLAGVRRDRSDCRRWQRQPNEEVGKAPARLRDVVAKLPIWAFTVREAGRFPGGIAYKWSTPFSRSAAPK